MCRWGGTPIEDAIKCGDKMIVRVLKSHGARVSASFKHDALFNAARTGSSKHLGLLLAAGADFSARNYDQVPAVLCPCPPISGM